METDPDFQSHHIKEQLIDTMINKLKPESATGLRFNVNECDLQTQQLLRDRYGFKAQPHILHDSERENEQSYTMNYELLSEVELLRHMNNKLKEITGGMEWQVVKLNTNQTFSMSALTDETVNTGEISFRTAGNVKDPKAAFTAICSYFGYTPKKEFLDSLTKAKRITIPSSWVEQIHTTKGKPGELAEYFVPSDFQSRRDFRDRIDPDENTEK